jgi:hypothetical protein
VVVLDMAGAVFAALGVDAALRRDLRAVGFGTGAAVAAAVVGVAIPLTLPSGRTVLTWALAGGLTALAAARVAVGRSSRLAIAALVALPVLELAVVAYQPVPNDPLPKTDAVGRIAPFLRADGGRAFISGAEELANQSFLRSALRPNINATEHVRSLDGYDGGPWLTKRWTQAMEALTRKPFVVDLTVKSQLLAPVEPALGARYGVKWFVIDRRVTDPAAAIPGWQGPVVSDGPLDVYENPEYRGEAVVYRRVRKDDGRPLYRQLASIDDPMETALVEDVAARACASTCTPVAAPLRRTRPERLVVDVAAAGPGTLVVAEGWDPGWSVRVDGRRRDLAVADRDFLAIPLREGDRSVVLTSRTPGLRAGAGISAATALVLLLAAGCPWWRRRARRRGVAGEVSDERAGVDARAAASTG